MERRSGEGVATVYVPEPFVTGREITLGEEAAHHLRVRRLNAGDQLAIVDGIGGRGMGRLVRLGKKDALVQAYDGWQEPPPSAVHVLAPIADKDRMLWLAEKVTELGAASWRPVLWKRSRSVSPRGEGMTFQGKVRARMISALEQSGGAWLPALFPDATVETAIAASPPGTKLLLDPEGDSILTPGIVGQGPVSIALGPEGGVDPAEREQLVAAGFRQVSVAGNILRFETAGIAALAIVQASLRLTLSGPANG